MDSRQYRAFLVPLLILFSAAPAAALDLNSVGGACGPGRTRDLFHGAGGGVHG